MVVNSAHKKTNRRVTSKHRKSKKDKKLTFFGTNSAGLFSKLHSFNHMLADVSPSVFFLEETKSRRVGKIKTAHCDKFQIFELVRKNGGGGGLALGANQNLNPTWLGEGNDDVEWLAVQITVRDMNIKCVVAYGPQEYDQIERKQKFWSQLDQEVTSAQNQGLGFILHMDGNLWAGPELIPGDPHQQNQNGKLFQEFLARNTHLSVVNSLQECEGLITRSRKTVKGLEESVIDFFIICDIVRPFLCKMKIDEKKINGLTNFHPAKMGRKVIESDHNPMIMELDLTYCKKKSERRELFNFKNEECQQTFFNLTNQTNKFTECFQDGNPFEKQATNWWKILNDFFHQSFRKVRISEKKIEETMVDKLMRERKELKKRIDQNDEDLEDKLNEVEKSIGDLCAEENMQKVMESFGEISENKDALNINGMWNVKKRIFPKISQIKPTGKKNAAGQIITSPEGLKEHCLD